jgi:hypothetical protein
MNDWASGAPHVIVSIGWEGMGLTQFRFRVVNGAGHVRCQVELLSETPAPFGVEDSPSHLSFEFRTEPGLVDRFARHLRRIAESHVGGAELIGTA